MVQMRQGLEAKQKKGGLNLQVTALTCFLTVEMWKLPHLIIFKSLSAY